MKRIIVNALEERGIMNGHSPLWTMSCKSLRLYVIKHTG